MAINKKNLLKESFTILRDKWPDKTEAIQKLVFKMAEIDIDDAINMWRYLIENNQDQFVDNGGSYRLLEAFLYNWSQKIPEKEIAFRIFNDSNLQKALFLSNGCVSYNTVHILRFIIEENLDKNLMLKLLEYIITNPNNTEFKIGKVISRLIEKLNEDEITITDSWSRFLISFLDKIKNPEDRAEATVALLDYM
ncbi:MAG: hypothetical protein J1F67_10715 [Muribaculaceae bacterium]|nr:hypothetical protein [Muribaculaceae bacterium]